MKNVFLSAAVIAAVLIGCPETPEAGTEGGSGSGTEAGAVPVDPASVELTNVSIGQDNGSIVVSWRDPAVDDLKSISIITRHGETGEIVDDGSVEPGTEKYTVAKEKLKVNETYILTLFGEISDGRKTAESKIARTLSRISLLFTRKNVYDTYAEFEWRTSSADEDLVFEYGGQEKLIQPGETSLRVDGLNPGTDYTFTLRTQSGDARIDWQAETMLFWDDFDYSTPEDLTASRWIWAERANSSNTGHWSFSMRGEDNKNRVELLDEDGSRFLRLKGEYQGPSADTEKMLGAGLRSQDRFSGGLSEGKSTSWSGFTARRRWFTIRHTRRIGRPRETDTPVNPNSIMSEERREEAEARRTGIRGTRSASNGRNPVFSGMSTGRRPIGFPLRIICATIRLRKNPRSI